MNNTLLFRRLLDPAQRDIVFGRPVGPALDAEGRLSIALPAAAPVTFVGLLRYDNAVLRSDVISTACAWQAAAPVSPAQLAAPHAPATPVPAVKGLPWQTARHASSATSAPWRSTAPLRTSVRAPWCPAVPLPLRSIAGGWQPADLLRGSLAGRWKLAARVSTRTSAPWQTANIIRTPAQRLPWGAGLPLRLTLRASAGPAETVGVVVARLPWGWGETLPPGRTVIIVTPPPEPWRCYTPPAGGAAHPLFETRRTPGFDILFTCGSGAPIGPRVVPILECYIVINAVSLVRADNGAEIPADALQLGIGSDGPHWTWSASLPGYARALVADRPEVIATLNGTPVRLVVERVRRDRRASQRGISDALQISGRSPSAWLSNPFAPASARTSESPYTAQQLAAEALTLNGVSMGWALDWRLPDWLVPAGAWSHRGTPMEAVLRIAEAGGGYIQAAAASQTLRALPHYPAAPWLWASLTPDLVLPEDVVEVEGTETADTAAYDVVYVEGIGPAGRRDRVRRTGTAGILPAPQIIDPLATDPDMTRARGLVALAASGPQTRVTLRLPVLQETGLILPGTLLDYAAEGATRRGIVRSFQADWTHPELWQSVEVECHG